MEFEDGIEELGGFGKFQKFLLWGFLLPSEILFSLISMNMIFLLSEPRHECVVPQLDALGLNESRVSEFRQLLVSEDECEVSPMRPLNSTRLAGEFDVTLWNASWFVNESATRHPCESFRYDDLYYDETVPTKWDLVCSRGHLISLLYSITTVGSIVGTLIIGALADKYGRKPLFFALVSLAIFSGFGTVLSFNYAMLVAMRFVNALLDPQMDQLPYLIVFELVGAKQRTLLLGVTSMGWTLGMCLLPLVAYLSRTWVLLATVCASCAVPIFCYIWSANGCAYGGLHINVTHLSGNEFLNFFYLALVEFPANAIGWWSMDRFGRRWTNVFFMLLTATACWAPVIAPMSGTVAIIASVMAKFSTTAAYMMMYQQSDELFPTPLRSFSVGVLTALTAVFTAGVPYVVYMGRYGSWIPFLFLALLTTTAGIAAAWLPETKDYPLCQTVEDADRFGHDQKFFSFNKAEESSKRSRHVEESDQKTTVELQPLHTET